MLVFVDPNSGVPVYRQIVDQIRFQIVSGVAKAGDELPSTRTLSLQLGVNPMTVSKSYSLLEDEGLVERRPGLPLVVCRIPAGAAESNRIQELRALLDPAVAGARQLGIPHKKALDVFRSMLEDAVRRSEAK